MQGESENGVDTGYDMPRIQELSINYSSPYPDTTNIEDPDPLTSAINSSELTSSCWQHFPLELLPLIPRLLISRLDMEMLRRNDNGVSDEWLQRRDLRTSISQCSLVCRSWARELRHLLFESHMILRSHKQMKLIYSISSASTSRWLCSYITAITLEYDEDKAGFWELSVQQIPFKQLTQLSYLQFSGPKLWSSEVSTLPLLQLRESMLLRGHPSLSSLYFSHFRFPSLTSLFKLAASVPLLEYLSLETIQWSGDVFQPTTTQFNQLAKLRSKAFHGFQAHCSKNSLLAWISVSRFLHQVFPKNLTTLMECGRSLVKQISLLFEDAPGIDVDFNPKGEWFLNSTPLSTQSHTHRPSI